MFCWVCWGSGFTRVTISASSVDEIALVVVVVVDDDAEDDEDDWCWYRPATYCGYALLRAAATM